MESSRTNRRLLDIKDKIGDVDTIDIRNEVMELIDALLDNSSHPRIEQLRLDVTTLEAFYDLAAEAKYYADRWPKQMPTLLKRLAEMCPEGREWKPTEEG